MAAAQPLYELSELQGFNESIGNFVEGNFLSVEQIHGCLKHEENYLYEERKKMITYIERTIPDQFLQLGITFPVTRLQHVTTETPTRQIVQSGYFHEAKTISLPWRHPNTKLIYWSLDVPIGDKDNARCKTFQTVQNMVGPHNAEEYEKDFNRQFANSPAFNSASRYGNFKFSFSLSDLLSEYKEQHCQGAEPEFRVLGTAMYKQEIAHIVLVHSPMATEFSDLPSVPIVGGNANPLPFVFRSQEDGKLYWSPESTADVLKMRIFENRCRVRECPLSCPYYDHGTCLHYRDTYSIWNELILAFHLPGNEPLRIPREKLLESLSACDILAPYLRKEETRLTQEGAQDIIRSLKNQ
ncbi:uncharacterized protein LOC116408927 isoform X2 [Xenopus tropicalis]|uniref:Uncharacterized protein LOC116408927 isoform X2 n=1 Tax=Xenopus tropicalis TaxID=8364 RepID=A0A8J1J5W9_XENTR|nr:uncharacterized protein LOC116408927 isoform X2 [Xenopus tropicalis]